MFGTRLCGQTLLFIVIANCAISCSSSILVVVKSYVCPLYSENSHNVVCGSRSVTVSCWACSCWSSWFLCLYVSCSLNIWNGLLDWKYLASGNLCIFPWRHFESVRCANRGWLFLRFNDHFPDEPGLAGVYWSKGWWKCWWQLEV